MTQRRGNKATPNSNGEDDASEDEEQDESDEEDGDQEEDGSEGEMEVVTRDKGKGRATEDDGSDRRTYFIWTLPYTLANRPP